VGNAIVKAIKRCELVCNPAIVTRPRFTIHVRRLSEGPTRSWLVSCTNNEALADEKAKSSEDPIPNERTSTDYDEKIHERNGAEGRASTANSISILRINY
jgi:hypothetical protein